MNIRKKSINIEILRGNANNCEDKREKEDAKNIENVISKKHIYEKEQ